MMRRRLILFASLALLFGVVRLWAACLDVTPIIVEYDAFDPDASCLKCLQQPENCATNIAACEEVPKCKAAYACMVAQACLDLRRLDDKITCGLPCAQDAGVESVSDPVVTEHLLGFVECGQEKCPEPCNLVDASIGL
jgi:hypothetical protein